MKNFLIVALEADKALLRHEAPVELAGLNRRIDSPEFHAHVNAMSESEARKVWDWIYKRKELLNLYINGGR